MEDASRIKASGGIQRGKSDKADAKRIAEYLARHYDKLSPTKLADEKVMETVANLAPPWTWVAPIALMPLSVFVSFIQTFVFILLSQLYLSEVSHPPHDFHAAHDETADESKEFIVPVLT